MDSIIDREALIVIGKKPNASGPVHKLGYEDRAELPGDLEEVGTLLGIYQTADTVRSYNHGGP